MKEKKTRKIISAVGVSIIFIGTAIGAVYYGQSIIVGHSTSNTLTDADSSGAVGNIIDLSDARYSLGVGQSNTAEYTAGGSGYSHLISGESNTIDANRSATALGDNNSVETSYSAAIGRGLIMDNASLAGVVVGAYNNEAGYSTDAAFVVGNGTSGGGNESNALIVLHNGDVIVPKRQGDLSMGSYD